MISLTCQVGLPIIIDQLRETLRLKRKQLSTLIATHVDLDFLYEENFSCFLFCKITVKIGLPGVGHLFIFYFNETGN